MRLENQANEKCNVYIDASGDTGFKFDNGSTKTFTIAVLVEHEIYAKSNRNLVIEAKKLAGRQPNQELKYSRLKRHPKKLNTLEKLREIQADLKIISVIKPEMEKPEDCQSMNALYQAFSIGLALEHVLKRAQVSHAEVWVDACNETLEQLIQELVSDGQDREVTNGEEEKLAKMISDIRFVNSKSNQMIQAADVFAGASAEFIEANVSNIGIKCKSCPSHLLYLRRQRECVPKKIWKRTEYPELLNIMLPLLARTTSGLIVTSGFTVIPVKANDHWKYIDCLARTKK